MTENITQFVEHIIYINLDESKDRLLKLQNEFLNGIQNDKITRFSAIKNNKGAIGCTQSHIKCLKLAIENGYENVMIIEDDAMWYNFKYIQKLNDIITKEYDVIVLGGTFPVYNNITYELESCQAANAYIVSKHYLQKLKENFEEGLRLLILTDNYPKYALDQYWKVLQKTDNWFIIPELIIQRPGFSTIENKYVDYTNYYKVKG